MFFDFCTSLPESADMEEIFQKISQAFADEGRLLQYLRATELIGSFTQGLSMVVLLGNNPVGHTKLVRLTEYDSPGGEWYELGSTWIHPEYRRRHLAVQLYERFLQIHDDKNILTTTTSAAAQGVGEKLGFVTVERKKLPEKVWTASCTCPKWRTGVDDNAQCLLAYGEMQQSGGPCWFSVTRSTALR